MGEGEGVAVRVALAVRDFVETKAASPPASSGTVRPSAVLYKHPVARRQKDRAEKRSMGTVVPVTSPLLPREKRD